MRGLTGFWRIGQVGALLLVFGTVAQSNAVVTITPSQMGDQSLVQFTTTGDSGVALMLAQHASALDGTDAQRQRILLESIAANANDPIADAAIDRILLEQQPDDLPMLRNLIATDLKLHNWQEVIPYLAHLAGLVPSDATARFQLSVLLLPTHPTDAEAQLHALVDDPVVGNLAQTALQNLTTQPLSSAIRAIGIQLASASQWTLANYLLQQSVNRNPQDNQAAALLGMAEEAQGRDGWALIQQAMAQAPDDPLIQYAVALHWQRIGNSQSALVALLQAQKINTGTAAQQAALSAAIGTAYLQNGALDQAAQAFQVAISLAPGNPGFNEAMAALYADDAYRPAEALPFIRTAIGKFPNDGELYASLGQVLLDSGQTNEAIKAAQQAVSLTPNSAHAQLVLGRCLEQSGDQSGAQNAYQAALLTADPSGVSYRALAGKALARAGYRPG